MVLEGLMSSAPSLQDVDSLPVLLPQRSVGYGSSLPLPGEQGDDLYASLLETSLPDLMGTSLSQMQDILPLQTYGSIGMSGLPVDGDDEGVLGHVGRASSEAEPLERQSPSNGHALDLGPARYSWVPHLTDDAFHHGMMPTTSTAEVNSRNILIRSGDNGSDKNAKLHPMVPVSLHKPSWMDSEQEDDETMQMLPRTPMACTSYAGNEDNQGVVFDGAGRMMEVSDDDSGEFLEQGKYSSHSSVNIRRVPLAVALLNLQCLHAGASLCYQNSWRGCRAGDWCSMESGHVGFCNQDARVPGPGAYMPEELDQVSLRTLDGSWMDLPLSKAAKDLANSMRGKSLEQACDTNVAPEKAQAVRKSNRRRAKPKVDDEDGYLFGASDDSVVSGEVQLSQVAYQDDSVNQVKPSMRASRGRKENLPVMPPVATRSSKKKPAKKIAAAGKKTKKGGRMGVRKPPQIWVKGAARDPRSGQMISDVPPGVFCTQCSATTTPVWRAGPFGHKTLCNACGVRWMKVDPRKR